MPQRPTASRARGPGLHTSRTTGLGQGFQLLHSHFGSGTGFLFPPERRQGFGVGFPFIPKPDQSSGVGLGFIGAHRARLQRASSSSNVVMCRSVSWQPVAAPPQVQAQGPAVASQDIPWQCLCGRVLVDAVLQSVASQPGPVMATGLVEAPVLGDAQGSGGSAFPAQVQPPGGAGRDCQHEGRVPALLRNDAAVDPDACHRRKKAVGRPGAKQSFSSEASLGTVYSAVNVGTMSGLPTTAWFRDDGRSGGSESVGCRLRSGASGCPRTRWDGVAEAPATPDVCADAVLCQRIASRP